MLTSVNEVTVDPDFKNEDVSTRIVSDMTIDLHRIMQNDEDKERLYHIRKYFICTTSDRITEKDFLIYEQWEESLFGSDSNLQVFYSAKHRHLLTNLMILEPCLSNLGCLEIAAEGILPEVLANVILDHSAKEEPSPHLTFAVMALNRIFRSGKKDPQEFLESAKGARVNQHLLNIASSASTKRTDFCALVFKYLQPFFNPETPSTA